MKKKYNWGIIGLGGIAEKFAEGLQVLPEARLFAVASRTQQKANDFAKHHHVPHAYGSYAEMLENKDIDIIYIATPHTFHCKNTLMCLEAGFHVLCEKPFAVNSSEVKKMIAKSREKKKLLIEAMWTAFLPSVKRIKEVINEGLIGKVEFIRADLGFRADNDPKKRWFNPDLGGGSLLDVGIYPAYLAVEILGRPDAIKALASTGHTGVDENCGFVSQYKEGEIASLYSSIIAKTAIDAMITGKKGSIHIHSNFFMPSGVSLVFDNNIRDITPEYFGNGYNYEAAEAMECLEKGLTESHSMNHEKSILLMETLDRIRNECGISYPEHDSKV
ncbi:MAG: Gfo/Idh/MocA family oxidoreductase [Bacteroidales bacterium]|nr:Gfo/Idh/MocA family oxidoreductase [Bacteroidales bacterium]